MPIASTDPTYNSVTNAPLDLQIVESHFIYTKWPEPKNAYCLNKKAPEEVPLDNTPI